ncbi:MAG TPA: tetratricopeptide repeat protein [Candidatus Acidoferrum sp.]|nr:tetratricopeptide repeat protein [Candidatus Acidoferrum sp.]
MSVTRRARRVVLSLTLGLFALVGAGCGNDQVEATKKLVEQQQDQLERQQQEIESIKAGQNYTPGVASTAPGGCDKGVETAASQRGGDKFAAGDFHKALGYYQDALSACSTDERAEVNIARTYEALGDNVSAIKFYRRAADAPGPTVSEAQEQAKAALLRLQADRMP